MIACRMECGVKHGKQTQRAGHKRAMCLSHLLQRLKLVYEVCADVIGVLLQLVLLYSFKHGNSCTTSGFQSQDTSMQACPSLAPLSAAHQPKKGAEAASKPAGYRLSAIKQKCAFRNGLDKWCHNRQNEGTMSLVLRGRFAVMYRSLQASVLTLIAWTYRA